MSDLKTQAILSNYSWQINHMVKNKTLLCFCVFEPAISSILFEHRLIGHILKGLWESPASEKSSNKCAYEANNMHEKNYSILIG